jgi:hypothetical protein
MLYNTIFMKDNNTEVAKKKSKKGKEQNSLEQFLNLLSRNIL